MRILWVSNAAWCTTGYGVQAQYVLPGFQEMGHECAQFAFFGLRGGRMEYGTLPIYPPGYDIWGFDVIGGHVSDFEADVVITLLDIWVVPPDYRQRVRPALWMPWFPVDCQPVPSIIIHRARDSDYPLVYSRFAQEQMARVGIPCEYIPHGVDCTVFAPADKIKSREALGLPREGFLAVMVAANKGWPSRKALPEQLAAFAAFADAHPELDARLYLHTEITGEAQGVDLRLLINNLRLNKRVAYANQYQLSQGLPASHLAQLYNAADVCLAATMGEGFGLPIIEAQACGCPVITTDWTAMPELTVNGIATEPAQPFWTLQGSWRALPSIENITAALEDIAGWSDERRAILSTEGVEHMHTHYAWPVVLERYWRPFLERVAAELPARRGHPAPVPAPQSERHTYVVGKIPLDIVDEPGSFAARVICQELMTDYALGVIPFREGDVVIDIGAHVGIVAIWLAKRYEHLGLKVYAYEPDWTNYRRLVRNVEANGVAEQVFAFHQGVTADGRTITLRGDREKNSGGFSAYVAGEEVSVAPTTTLRTILEQHGPARLLKIDCEGAEYEALGSLSDDDWRAIDYLRGEFHINEQIAAAGWDAQELLGLCLQHLTPDRIRVKSIRKVD